MILENYHLTHIDMEHVLRKVLLIDYIRDGYALEFQNSCVKIVIGLVFLLIGPLTFSTNPEMYRFVAWIPPRAWGILFITLGISHLVSLFGKYKQTRKNILLIAGGIWVWFSSSLLFGSPASPVGYVYLVFSLSTFRCYLCIRFFKRFDLHDTSG